MSTQQMYFCETCQFKTHSRKNYNTHIETIKHKKLSEPLAENVIVVNTSVKEKENEIALLQLKMEQQQKDFQIELLKIQLANATQNSGKKNSDDDNKKVLPITYMTKKMRNNMVIESKIEKSVLRLKYDFLDDYIDDECRTILVNCVKFQSVILHILNKFLDSIGGVRNSPIVCLDRQRKKMMYHIQNEAGDIEWYEDKNNLFFKTMVSDLFFHQIMSGTKKERENFPESEQQREYYSYDEMKMMGKRNIYMEDRLRPEHLLHEKISAFKMFQMKTHNIPESKTGGDEYMEVSQKFCKWDTPETPQYCYKSLLNSYCNLFSINDLVDEYNESL
jgi:hypothetical protein